jgi:predicted DsbA family dithiol-disulfide isomerase
MCPYCYIGKRIEGALTIWLYKDAVEIEWKVSTDASSLHRKMMTW